MLIIGNGFSTSAERYFRSKIDNFMLFSRALTDAEVYSIYQFNGDCTLWNFNFYLIFLNI